MTTTIAHCARCSIASALLLAMCLPGLSASSIANTKERSWSALFDTSVETLESDRGNTDSARYWLILAYKQLNHRLKDSEQSLAKATALAAAVDKDKDSAAIAGAIRCALASEHGRKQADVLCEHLSGLATETEDPLISILVHNVWALFLASRGRYKEALIANQNAAQLARLQGREQLLATLLNNRGVSYLALELPRLAVTQFTRARELTDPIQDPLTTRLLSLNIASAQVDQGHYEDAVAILTQVVEAPDNANDNYLTLTNATWLARAYLGLGDLQQAQAALIPVLARIGSNSQQINYGAALAVLARIHITQGDTQKGLATFDQAIRVGEEANDRYLLRKWKVRFAASLREQGELGLASPLLNAVIDEYQDQTAGMTLVYALEEQSKIDAQQGETGAATAAYQRAQNLRNALYGEQFDLELSSLQLKLETDTNERALALAKRDAITNNLQAQRNALLRNFVFLCSLLVATIIYLLLSRRFAKQRALLQRENNARLESLVSERSEALEQEMAERLQVEQNQRSLEQSLAESEKLRAVGQLTSGVAHDFNNLMTVVTLSAGLIKLDKQLQNTQATAYVDEILKAAETGSSITTDLLAFARKQPLQAVVLDLQEYLSDALPLFKRTLGEGIDLQTNLRRCAVTVDRAKLTTSIINLLVNAKEALAGRGTVELRVELHGPDKQCSDTTPRAAICISDNGPGMSSQEIARSIEPFYTTKTPGQATGLGLSMVYGFAKQSGGDLLIESGVSSGTTVTLLIPQSSPEQQSDDRRDRRLAASQLNPGRVLVVEDQPHVRAVLCRLLEHLGMQTVSAANGNEGLQILQRSEQDQAPPDLVISDVMMPGTVSAQQMIDFARSRFPAMRILLMSGYTDTFNQDVHFLHKPFSLDELRAAVTAAMGTETPQRKPG